MEPWVFPYVVFSAGKEKAIGLVQNSCKCVTIIIYHWIVPFRLGFLH